ncbi:MAG: class I SAM-dependent methyltransferase [Candidatus Omnitrophota bacterium]
MSTDNIFDEYYEAIFRSSNKYSQAEYEDHVKNFDLVYAKYLTPEKQAKILDVGCGTGYWLYYLKKKGYTNYSGIDISAQQVKICRERINAEVEQADVFEYLKNKENSYDLIVGHDILEHIPKTKVITFLRLIYEALKPGGKVFLRTLNCGNPMSLRIRYADFTHEFAVTEKSFYQILYLSGFRDIKILPNIDKGFLNKIVANMIRFVLSKIMWYQGFVVPRILTPVIFGIAKK